MLSQTSRSLKESSQLVEESDSLRLDYLELAMLGSDDRSGSLFSYVDLEAQVRPDRPLRTLWTIANAAKCGARQRK